MTLIVGIKCSDGVVMGADGATTFSALGAPTIRQPTKHKITIFADSVAVGVSGPVGLGQRITAKIQEAWDKNQFAGKSPTDAMTHLRNLIWEPIKLECEVAAAAGKTFGQLALLDCNSATMVALPLKKGFHLFTFDQQGAPEEVTDRLPFTAIGSGQPIADTFLAFLRKVFWPSAPPTLNGGIFATLWTIKHAIETHPGGVADPYQIFSMQSETRRASECGETELQLHEEAIAGAVGALKDYRAKLDGSIAAGTSEVPPPPEPSVK